MRKLGKHGHRGDNYHQPDAFNAHICQPHTCGIEARMGL